MHRIVDKIVELFKWPVAIFLLMSLPALFSALDYFNFASLRYMALFGGFLFFFVARTMMDSSVRTSMEVLAHEMTHAFFALLTLHKVKGLKINSDDSGGSMCFEGEGNWLIIIAPYFFPLFGFIAMLTITVYQWFAPMNILVIITFGYVIGYHVDTVCSQIHEKQTDLPKVGYAFCAVFLLPANLWMIGWMLVFNSRGWSGIPIFNSLIWQLDKKFFSYALNLIGF